MCLVVQELKNFRIRVMREIDSKSAIKTPVLCTRATSLTLFFSIYCLLWTDITSHRSCSVKRVFLKFSQNSQENISVRVSFLIKLEVCNINKKDFNTGVFLWILRTSFFKKEHRRWLFLSRFKALAWCFLCLLWQVNNGWAWLQKFNFSKNNWLNVVMLWQKLTLLDSSCLISILIWCLLLKHFYETYWIWQTLKNKM